MFESLTCDDGALTLRAAWDPSVVATGSWIERVKSLLARDTGEVSVTWTSRDAIVWRGPVTRSR